jgi:hypothetical protein
MIGSHCHSPKEFDCGIWLLSGTRLGAGGYLFPSHGVILK